VLFYGTQLKHGISTYISFEAGNFPFKDRMETNCLELRNHLLLWYTWWSSTYRFFQTPQLKIHKTWITMSFLAQYDVYLFSVSCTSHVTVHLHRGGVVLRCDVFTGWHKLACKERIFAKTHISVGPRLSVTSTCDNSWLS